MKRLVFKLHFFWLISLICGLQSCRSEEQVIKEANSFVNEFVHNIQLENFETVKKTYPDFKFLSSYWKLENFSISETKLIGDTAIVFGTYQNGNKNETVSFHILVENENFQVMKSKGLSGYMNSPLYLFCKNVGCLAGLESDAEISIACQKRENHFNNLISILKKNIEENVKLGSHNVQKGYGYISGDVSINNLTSVNIPAFSYDLYIILIDDNGREIYRTKSLSSVYQLPAQGSVSTMVHEQSTRNMSKIGIELKITNTRFLSEIVANPPKDWDCEFVDAGANGTMDEYILQQQFTN
jgi:hypothetical protein